MPETKTKAPTIEQAAEMQDHAIHAIAQWCLDNRDDVCAALACGGANDLARELRGLLDDWNTASTKVRDAVIAGR